MQLSKKAHEIILILERRDFYGVCPCCEKPVLLRKCGLFYLDDLTPKAEKLIAQRQIELTELAAKLKKRRKKIPEVSMLIAEAVNKGLILERLAPSLSAFRFERNDCRALFDPIDYIIFEGLSTKGRVSRMFFAEMKSGDACLSPRQKQIRSLVEARKVSFLPYESEGWE